MYVNIGDGFIKWIPDERYERLQQIKNFKSSIVIFAYNERFDGSPADERYEPISVDELEYAGDSMIPNIINSIIAFSNTNSVLQDISMKIAKPMRVEYGKVFLEFENGNKTSMDYKVFFEKFIIDDNNVTTRDTIWREYGCRKY